MKKFILLFIVTIVLASCDSTEPEDKEKPTVKTESGVTINVERFSCTYAWIDFAIPPGGRVVYMNTEALTTPADTFFTKDTTIYVEHLLPGKEYTITATCPETESYIEETITCKFSTLDTTSHDFTYQVFEIGEGITNNLYGVDIIDENNIWAVGEVNRNDTFFNVIKWDGNRFNYYDAIVHRGGKELHPLFEDISMFSLNSVWLTSTQPSYYDGQNWEYHDLRDSINSSVSTSVCYGENENEIYFAGRGDKIVKYDHGSWQLYDKYTDLPINEVYVKDGTVYATGSSSATNTGILLRKGKGQNLFTPIIEGADLSEEGNLQQLYGRLASIWVDENNILYTGCIIMYQYKNSKWDYVNSLPGNYFGNYNMIETRGNIFEIDGNASNDMFIAGDRGTLMHFNGVSWQQIGDGYDAYSGIKLYSLSVKNETICVVGLKDSKAYIVILKH